VPTAHVCQKGEQRFGLVQGGWASGRDTFIVSGLGGADVVGGAGAVVWSVTADARLAVYEGIDVRDRPRVVEIELGRILTILAFAAFEELGENFYLHSGGDAPRAVVFRPEVTTDGIGNQDKKQ